MRRLFAGILFLLSGNVLFAQSTPGGMPIPKITQAPPDAFSFTRYGDIPVGLFTGSMSFSVPLFQASSGKLSVPISLEYTTNGVKVNDVSGRTGVDWVLRSGGVITKTAMGRPDDLAINTPPNNGTATPNNSDSVAFYNWMKFVGDNNDNIQPDEYTYNFMGYNGKFYFDYQGNLRQISPDGLKISQFNSGLNFKIVSTDGTQYFFSQKDQNYNYSLYGENVNINPASLGGTSWFLDKIKNVYNDSIVFKYTILTTGTANYASGISQTYEASPTSSYFNYPRFIAGDNCSNGFGSFYTGPLSTSVPPLWITTCPEASNESTTDISMTWMLQTARLDEIEFKSGRIKLFYSSRDDLPGEPKLDSLALVSRQTGQLIKAVSLKYEYSQSDPAYTSVGFHSPLTGYLADTYPYLKKRLFLKKVNLSGQASSTPSSYEFEYNNINSLPPRLSYAQDFWGYFNGKMNLTMIPSNNLFNGYYWLNTGISNRSPDSAYNKRGVLTKITYPTKGFTLVEYEANQMADAQLELLDTVALSINYAGQGNTTVYSNTFSMTNAVEINLSSDWYAEPDPDGPQPPDPMVIFSIENITNPSQNLSFLTKNVPVGQVIGIYENLNVLVPGNVYRLKLQASETYIKGKVEFKHWHYASNPVYNKVSAGLRVRSIRNYSYTNKLENTKRFSYNVPGSQFSSGHAIIDFPDSRDYCYTQPVVCAGSGQVQKKFIVSSSSSLTGFKNDYASVNYSHVTETFDSAGLGGSITTCFLVGENKLPETFACVPSSIIWERSPFLVQGTPLSNNGYMNGKEVQKIVYKRVGADTIKLQETINYYSTDTSLYHEGRFYSVRKNITRSNYNLTWRYWSDYDVNVYKRITAWVHVDSTIQKNYEAAGQTLTTKQAFKYANPTHLQATDVYSISSKGDTLKQAIRFADDQRILTPADPVLTGLVNSNIITAPLLQRSYSNSQLLTTVQTDYNSSLYPSILKKSYLNNPLQVEAEITLYDANGNIREVKEKDMYSSFIIDTSINMIIAGVQNANVADIAYTSFETGNKGNWSYAGTVAASTVPTGKNYYNLTTTNTLTKTVASGKTYVVSYWRNNASAFTVSGGTADGYNTKAGPNGWYYHEHRIIANTTTITITGTGSIDEVRLYPKNSLMTTYTYEPLIGITTQCDNNNRIIYYEYDVLNRLTLVRDQDRNILKKVCYNYFGQPEDCGVITYSSAAASGSFTRNNCSSGTGGTVTYSVGAGAYTSTISQADADLKATNDVSANGQAYANANATCTWKNAAQSGSFTRNNCGAGGTGGTVTYTIAANTYTSTTSQADANQQAVNAVNAGGQAYANANATCTWYNTAQNGNFTRNNCGAGGTGGTVTYTKAANTYSSTVSQADANQQALNAVNEGGQAYANANATCTWYNAAQSGSFTRNNCAAGGTGGTVTYTISASSYSSTVSQADANQQAVNAVNAGGQAYANANATCTWKNTAQSGNFTRNNCGAGGTGSTVTYTINANTYTSTVSQADANQQAINAVNAGGQAYANANATCTWYNTSQSGSFTRNNCGSGGTGGTVTYTIAASTYSSNVSQADANQQAVNAVNAGGQNYANANAGCTWYNQFMSQSFTRNNCVFGYQGSSVSYNVAANTYSSTVSLAAANQLAQNNINANGQSYANTNGTCTPIPCNSTTCGGENMKCIGGVCEMGYKVYISSVWNESMHMYECTYHYEFSDFSWSSNYVEYSGGECPLF